MAIEVAPRAGQGSSEIGIQTVALLRGFDYLVTERTSRREKGNGELVIDIDGAPEEIGHTPFKDLNQVQGRVGELIDQVRDNPNIPYADIIMRKLVATHMAVRVRQGEDVPFDEQLAATMNVRPEWVGKAELAHRRRLLTALLPDGMEYRREDKAAYEAEFALKTEDVQGAIEAGIAAGASIASRFFELQDTVRPQQVDVPQAWSGYVSTDENGKLFFKYNTNKNYVYTPGEAATLAGHEFYGHVQQIQSWMDAIQAGEMDPSLAVTTLNTPECTHIETVGQLGGALFVNHDQLGVPFQVVYDDATTGVYNNMSLLANGSRVVPPQYKVRNASAAERAEIALNYGIEELPFKEEGLLKQGIEERQDPNWRAYLACYRRGAVATRAVLAMQPEQQRAAIEQLYQPITVPDIDTILAVNASRTDR